MISQMLSASLAALCLINSAVAAPLKRSTSGPRITSDFPDPSILRIGSTWYALGTQSLYDYKNVHIQVASSSDFNNWGLWQGTDALPNLPSWVDSSDPRVWAPDVIQVGDRFVLYFAAATNSDGGYHCVGTATSNSITGPYTPSNDPFACPTGQGGAIDASGFVESDGTRYVVYKIDANAKGHGGSCNNGVQPIVSTPIMIQKVGSDGISKIGDPVQILANEAEDGPLVEAPSLIRDGSGKYVLFYSSGCFVDDSYTTKYATSSSPYGPFTRAPNNPLLSTGKNGLHGPGGLDAGLDGVHVAFHGRSTSGDGRRFMYTGIISVDDTTVTV